MRENGRYSRINVDEATEPFSAHAYFMNNPSLSGRGKALDYNAPKKLSLPKKQSAAPERTQDEPTQDEFDQGETQ